MDCPKAQHLFVHSGLLTEAFYKMQRKMIGLTKLSCHRILIYYFNCFSDPKFVERTDKLPGMQAVSHLFHYHHAIKSITLWEKIVFVNIVLSGALLTPKATIVRMHVLLSLYIILLWY